MEYPLETREGGSYHEKPQRTILSIHRLRQPDQNVVIRFQTARELEQEERALKRFDREADDNLGVHWAAYDSAEWESLPQTRPEAARLLRSLLAVKEETTST